MLPAQNGLIDNRLRHIKDVYNLHQVELDGIEDEGQRLRRLCELNVQHQVRHVCSCDCSECLEPGQSLSVHGWIWV